MSNPFIKNIPTQARNISTGNTYNFNAFLQNPQAQQLLRSIQSRYPANTSPQQIASEMAKDRGIDLNQMVASLRRGPRI